MASEKRLRFVDEYLKDRNASAAYQRAGYKATGNSAEAAACRMLKEPDVAQLIGEREAAMRKRVEMDQDCVARLLWSIATADANDLIQHRRLCCRYCYGVGFGYQRTAGERERDYERWLREEKKAQKDDPEREPTAFDEAGGIGYHKLKAPNPDCPECFGEGVTDIYLPDTRLLSDDARMLYAGVKVTKEGLEVKMHARDAAIIKIGEHLGMFKKLHEHSGAVGLLDLAESIAPDQQERVTCARASESQKRSSAWPTSHTMRPRSRTRICSARSNARHAHRYWRKSMTPQGRKIWASPSGVSLLNKVLYGKPLTPQDQQTIDLLKKSGPPNQNKRRGPAANEPKA